MHKKNVESLKVVVVGAGISGLAAGIYAKRAGFDVTILEKHIIPGGLSTGWSRKGYFFEGGMHWLGGSSEKFVLNRIWKEVGALQNNNQIFYKDPFYTLKNSGKELHLYRDIDKLEKHLLEYAPEDFTKIKSMCRDIRIFKYVHLVISDIRGLKTKSPIKPSIKELFSMLPALFRTTVLYSIPCTDYINEFKNTDLKHLFMSIIGSRYNAVSLVYTLASFASGDCGYPEGGSLRMTRNMADTFENLGGKIRYKCCVDKIAEENGTVKGVFAGREFIAADAVIVSSDTRIAIDSFFEKPLKEAWVNKMRKEIISEQNMFICLGIKADLSSLPRAVIFPLQKEFEAGSLKFGELRINNYAAYKNHSPEGCTALTCLLLGDSYNYWKKAKEDGSYKQKKQELAENFINTLSEFIPDIKDKIEVTDVATPLTYEKYCNTFMGGWMSVWEAKKPITNYPSFSKDIKGLYFCGQRIMMPGGLPLAVYSGRIACQYLCRDRNIIFV